MPEVKNPKIESFKNLKIWNKSITLVEQIYQLTRSLPKEEIFGLTSQMRRAAVSIPSNIAEGFTRFHNREYRQFLFMALGNCAELTTQIIISKKLGYVENSKAEHLTDFIEQICKMTMSLIKKLNTND